MNLLQRALIEKAGCEHGWEIVLQSIPEAVVLASARHRAKVRIQSPGSGGFWLDVPEGLIQRELARSFPEIPRTSGAFPAADLAQALPHQAARTYEDCVQSALKTLAEGGSPPFFFE